MRLISDRPGSPSTIPFIKINLIGKNVLPGFNPNIYIQIIPLRETDCVPGFFNAFEGFSSAA